MSPKWLTGFKQIETNWTSYIMIFVSFYNIKNTKQYSFKKASLIPFVLFKKRPLKIWWLLQLHFGSHLWIHICVFIALNNMLSIWIYLLSNFVPPKLKFMNGTTERNRTSVSHLSFIVTFFIRGWILPTLKSDCFMFPMLLLVRCCRPVKLQIYIVKLRVSSTVQWYHQKTH